MERALPRPLRHISLLFRSSSDIVSSSRQRSDALNLVHRFADVYDREPRELRPDFCGNEFLLFLADENARKSASGDEDDDGGTMAPVQQARK